MSMADTVEQTLNKHNLLVRTKNGGLVLILTINQLEFSMNLSQECVVLKNDTIVEEQILSVQWLRLKHSFN